MPSEREFLVQVLRARGLTPPEADVDVMLAMYRTAAQGRDLLFEVPLDRDAEPWRSPSGPAPSAPCHG